MKDKWMNTIKRSDRVFIEEDLRPFLQIASNTGNPPGIKQAKEYIIQYIADICDDITEIKGEINPLFLGHVSGKKETPLLIYMMYDTQPVYKKEEWIAEPFAADYSDLPSPLDSLGQCIIARGAYNSKSPLMCFLNTIKLLKKDNALPVSLILLFDGEEERGSPTLLKVLDNTPKLFQECKAAYYPAAKQDLNGNAVLKLGYKGILSLTLTIHSPNKEPHSAFSAMIPNPASELTTLISLIFHDYKFQISSLKNPYQLTPEEQDILNTLYSGLDLEKTKRKAGITLTRFKDPKRAFREYLFSPTFNLSTLKSGFLEEGIKNFTPNEATCNIDIRFAHKINIETIYKEINEIVSQYDRYSPSNIRLIKHIGYESSRVQRNSPLVKSIIHSFKPFKVNTEIWPISAAAAPLSKIQNILGIDFIVGGMGIGGYAHQANEFIQVSSISQMRLMYSQFLQNISQFFS